MRTSPEILNSDMGAEMFSLPAGVAAKSLDSSARRSSPSWSLIMPFLTSRSMRAPLSWARAAVAHTRAARPANTLDLRLNMSGWMGAWMNDEARRFAGIGADNRGRVLRSRDARVTKRQNDPHALVVRNYVGPSLADGPSCDFSAYVKRPVDERRPYTKPRPTRSVLPRRARG